MTVYTLLKIKPGKRQVWLDWCDKIQKKHLEEAKETLREEDLVHERCLIFGEGDNSFVLYKHQPLEGKKKKPFNPARELNQIHNRKFHECLERIGVGTVGYDIDIRNDSFTL